MYCVDATDGVIQSDSTDDNYSDSNEASDEDEEDDVRSSSVQSVRRQRSLSPCVEETIEVATDEPPVEAPKDDPWDTSASRKKGHKNSKSKISERRAVFES
jgi:hypothetical protein